MLRCPLLPTPADREADGARSRGVATTGQPAPPCASAHLRVGRACRTTGPHPAHRHLPRVHRLAGQRSCPRRRWPSVAPAQAEATDRALDPSRARTGELTRSGPASTVDSRRRPLGDQHIRRSRPVSLRAPDKGTTRTSVAQSPCPSPPRPRPRPATDNRYLYDAVCARLSGVATRGHVLDEGALSAAGPRARRDPRAEGDRSAPRRCRRIGGPARDRVRGRGEDRTERRAPRSFPLGPPA